LHRNQLLLDLPNQGIDLNRCFTVGFLRCELGRVFSYCLLFGIEFSLDESNALFQVLDLLLGLLRVEVDLGDWVVGVGSFY
jgi:hypothetical protein